VRLPSSDRLKKSALYLASCNLVEIWLRVEPDCAWLTIKGPGPESEYYDIPQGEVAGIVEQFLAIGEDVDCFNAFVQTWGGYGGSAAPCVIGGNITVVSLQRSAVF
jgi:hypothetical protein